MVVANVGSDSKPRFLTYTSDIHAHISWGGCLHHVSTLLPRVEQRRVAIGEHKSVCLRQHQEGSKA